MPVYIPLARKYRPKKFSDVIGQDITVKILSKAIENDRLGSVILLTGTRGVGKTTIARILAKIIRCKNTNGVDPCDNCDSCLEFHKASQTDVIEMDAASHTSVDDIREIIDSCKYAPSTGKYRVYIIDEVHMLSKSAFNALLKTLEEPPEHVKFIFATTELYKIPETVLSRCLNFNLKRIDSHLLMQFLSSVCSKEMVKFEENALLMIARSANGSIRDALSILEQAINLSNSVIMESQVREMLGNVSYIDAFDLLKNIISANGKESIIKCRDMIRVGADPKSILEAILELTHKMTCLKLGAGYFGNCILSHDDEIKLAIDSKEVPLSRLSTLWQILLKGNTEMHDSEIQQVALEMLIIRLCYASSLPDLTNIVSDVQGSKLTKSIQKNYSQVRDESSSLSIKDSALKMFDGEIIN